MPLPTDSMFVVISKDHANVPLGVYATVETAIAAADEWTQDNLEYAYVVTVPVEQKCRPGFTTYDNSLTLTHVASE